MRVNYKHSEETKKKIGNRLYPRGNKHHSWKGDKIGYAGLYDWIVSVKGRPMSCEFCGFTEEVRAAFAVRDRFEWANKSGEYKRDVNDWIRLCIRCHRKYDKKS